VVTSTCCRNRSPMHNRQGRLYVDETQIEKLSKNQVRGFQGGTNAPETTALRPVWDLLTATQVHVMEGAGWTRE